mgnify:FL=1|jgi:hypothetical protein
MADLKLGNLTPAVGNVKLGSNNVSEIYQGATKLWPLATPPQPGEVTVCDLVWTKTNSTITATTTGGNIPIVTDATGWGQAAQNQQPAACYYQHDPVTYGYLGLYYNKFCLSVIQPPTGFRLPGQWDWNDLRSCLPAPPPSTDITYSNQIANNYYNLWPSAVNSLQDINTVDFNSIAGGYTRGDVGPNQNYFQEWVGLDRSYFWRSNQSSANPLVSESVLHYYNSTLNYIQLTYSSVITSPTLTYSSAGFNIRFVKDVVTVNLYDNDTQTGPTVNSIVEQTLSPVGNSGQYGNFNINRGSVVVPSGGGEITFFQYLDDSTMPSITDGYFTEGRIRVYYNSSRSGSIAAEVNWTQANQGGTWSPDGSANQKEQTISLPQGTYYLKLDYFAEKPNPPGPAYQVRFNTGVSV